MARAQVKICGITTEDALVAAISAGADAVGFVFFPPSPRAIAAEHAAGLSARAPHILKVGLFVDADDDLLDSAVNVAKIGAIQLQGKEPPERIAAIQRRFGLPVWRAIGVKTAADIQTAERQAGTADLLLLDAKAPAGAVLPGGNGLAFDWRILADRRPARNWGLAGGLLPETVGDAIRLTGAPLVDVSSGVEDAPGAKNLAKIAAFVEAARRA